jgi:hypothetical protein
MGREAGVTSYRREDAPTVKRGEWALEEAEVRREAWYARLGAWKAAEGDEGAEMVGEDEVSMSRQHCAALRAVTGGRDGQLGRRVQREVPTAVVQYRHSRRQCRGEGVEVERTARQRLIGRGRVLKGEMPPCCARSLAARWQSWAARWRATASHWAATASPPSWHRWNARLWLVCVAQRAILTTPRRVRSAIAAAASSLSSSAEH